MNSSWRSIPLAWYQSFRLRVMLPPTILCILPPPALPPGGMNNWKKHWMS